MRRALLLAAAIAVPLAVLAAVTARDGQVVEVSNYSAAEDSSYINFDACADTAAAPKVNLEWAFTGTATGTLPRRPFPSACPS